MFVVYGASLVLWLMLMDVGAEKSWETVNIGKGKEFARMLVRLFVAGMFAWFLASFGGYEGKVNPAGAVFAPFSTAFYYGIYILFNRNKRESWKEYLKLDRWNVLVLAGCFITALVSSTMS